MPLITQTDMIDRYGAERLAEVTTRSGPVTGIDTDALQVAIDDAASEVDSYVAGRYDPADPPRVLALHAAAVAWYRLLGDRGPAIEGAKAAYEQALTFLRRARSREVSLGDETPGATQETGAGGVRIKTAEGIFTDDNLKGFR